MNTLRNVFWIASIALVACFALFVVLGAFPLSASGIFIVMGVLAALFAGHMWAQSRQQGPRDPRLVHDRERRGF
jgi:MFS-type transporter involved in bile tolerance (Atg22 family)